MKIQVLKVTTTGKGFNVATIRAGSLFGECLASEDVIAPGDYWLKSTLKVQAGRLVPLIRVEKLPA